MESEKEANKNNHDAKNGNQGAESSEDDYALMILKKGLPKEKLQLKNLTY